MMAEGGIQINNFDKVTSENKIIDYELNAKNIIYFDTICYVTD